MENGNGTKAKRGFFPLVMGRDVDVRQGGGVAFLARHDVHVNQGGGQWIVGLHEVEVNEGGAAVIVGKEVEIEKGFVGLVLAPKVTLEEGARVLATWKQAAAFGLALGAAIAVLRRMPARKG